MADEPIATPRSVPRTTTRIGGAGRTTKKVIRKPATRGEVTLYGAVIYTVQAMWGFPQWYRGWKEYFYPHSSKPNIVKAYGVRPSLPVR